MSFGNVIFAQDLFFQGGLATVENGSVTVTGSLNAADGTTTAWASAALEGDTIAIGATRHYIKRIVSDMELELTEPWSGPDATASGYTGARAPWHLADRALAYKFARFLEGDATASSTAVAARDDALAARADAIAARDLAAAWASRPANTDVTTAGTRSALHHASMASASAMAAAASAVTGADWAQRAADWAEKADNTDVAGASTRSAKHWAGRTAADATAVAADRATTVTAKDDALAALEAGEAARDLAAEWAQKPYGQAITGTTTGRSALHYAADAAASAAAAAAIVFAGTSTIDYGFITDLPTDFADYGGLT